MRRDILPISSLPAWCKLNDVSFLDTSVRELPDKGFGLVTTRALSSEQIFDTPTLLVVPKNLVLDAEAIEEWAKVDGHFRELVNAVGGKGVRRDAMLFLLLQLTIAAEGKELGNVGLSGPWTEYVKILASEVPVPTMWSEEERVLLLGTSLESALNAKMAALLREFEDLREKTEGIPWCKRCWWETGSLSFSDWQLLDAWYRSRCVELPHSGESLVPCLDMANHSAAANAYYDQIQDNSVNLLLRPDLKVESDTEITISYGSSKSQAEMLFSYGFIDEQSSTREIVLPIEPFDEDPLGKAKVAAFKSAPIVRISDEDGTIQWDSPFIYLMCLNEEDGLDFKVLLQNDGSRSALHVFWQETDVTGETSRFETLIAGHELEAVFRLRAVALLQDKIQRQLERLHQSEDIVLSVVEDLPLQRSSAALQLRKTEMSILEAAFASTDLQKNKLLEDPSVVRYLNSMQSEDPVEQSGPANEEDDFS